VAMKYKSWLHLFYEKNKKQFIPLAWKVDEIFLRGTAKIDEYAAQFDQYNMKFAKEIKGFDPNHIFHDHMVSFGFNNTLINNFIFGEEEGDNHDPPAECIERKASDIETIISTTDQYK
jgi:hypothetical protein